MELKKQQNPVTAPEEISESEANENFFQERGAVQGFCGTKKTANARTVPGGIYESKASKNPS